MKVITASTGDTRTVADEVRSEPTGVKEIPEPCRLTGLIEVSEDQVCRTGGFNRSAEVDKMLGIESGMGDKDTGLDI
jgi:hypothetical protein